MNAFPLDPSVEYPGAIENLGRFLHTLREAQVEHNHPVFVDGDGNGVWQP